MVAGSSTSLVELLADERTNDLSEADVSLLRLVPAGLTDHEIGRQLYLSHHTVKHRIDRSGGGSEQEPRAARRVGGGQEAASAPRRFAAQVLHPPT